MNTGEWVLVSMWALSLGIAALLHGTPKSPSKHNFFETFFYICIGAAILYWAGLFHNI